MAIEQHMRARALAGSARQCPTTIGLPNVGSTRAVKSDLAEGAGAPFRRGDAGLVKSGVGRDAGDGKQPEQPFERRFLFALEPVEHVLQRRASVFCDSLIAMVRRAHTPSGRRQQRPNRR